MDEPRGEASWQRLAVVSRFGKPESNDGSAEGAIASFPLASLRSAKCSAVPLLTLWRDGLWRQRLLQAVALGGGEPVQATFEYRVPYHCDACGDRRGKSGVDSHTDLMLETSSSAVAIEAKYMEPRYDTVAKWLSKGNDRRNREAVLRHWLHLISGRTGSPIHMEQVQSLVNQHVHRAASACFAARPARAPKVVHLLFGDHDARRQQYRRDLAAMRAVIGPQAKLGLQLICIDVEPDSRVAALYVRHRCRDRSTAEEVKGALLGPGALYRFRSKPVVEKF